MTILPNPSYKEYNCFAKHIYENDALILASPMKHSDYLLTLDNKFLKIKHYQLGLIQDNFDNNEAKGIYRKVSLR